MQRAQGAGNTLRTSNRQPALTGHRLRSSVAQSVILSAFSFTAGCLLWVTGRPSLPVNGRSWFLGTAFFIVWLGLFSSELADIAFLIFTYRQFRYRPSCCSRQENNP